MAETRRLVLASGSPRRRDLLASVGLAVEVRPADVDEREVGGESPTEYVCRVAARKLDAGWSALDDDGAVMVAADTTVELDGSILAKPADEAALRAMLTSLSGRAHQVHTAVAVRSPRGEGSVLVTTDVIFTELSAADIDWYVGVGESYDKAGGYALQSAGAALVERVDGSVTNVIGLPLVETLRLLADAGIQRV